MLRRHQGGEGTPRRRAIHDGDDHDDDGDDGGNGCIDDNPDFDDQHQHQRRKRQRQRNCDFRRNNFAVRGPPDHDAPLPVIYVMTFERFRLKRFDKRIKMISKKSQLKKSKQPYTKIP